MMFALEDENEGVIGVFNIGSPCGTRRFSRESVAHKNTPTASLPPDDCQFQCILSLLSSLSTSTQCWGLAYLQQPIPDFDVVASK